MTAAVGRLAPGRAPLTVKAIGQPTAIFGVARLLMAMKQQQVLQAVAASSREPKAARAEMAG